MNTFFIDFETTGLNPYHDEIIEFAIKKYKTDKIICNLVKPQRVKMIPSKITEITGITTQDIFNGNTISNINACEQIFSFLNENYDGDGYIYLIAHNGIPFDFVYLKELMKMYSQNINTPIETIDIFNIYPAIRFIDSLDIARKFVPHIYSYSQKNLCKIFNIIQDKAHRADGDVIDLEKVYYTIVNYGINKFKYDKDLIDDTDKVYDNIYNI